MAETQKTCYITSYGWDDNDPPGDGIANPVVHQAAGGTGTFSDPITLAVCSAQVPYGTKAYIPGLRRYFVAEDYCQASWDDYNSGIAKIRLDVWCGHGTAAYESSITADYLVIFDPAPNYAVNPGGLYDTGQTNQGNTIMTASSAPASEPTSGPVNFVQNGVVITGPIDLALAGTQVPNISAATRQANGIAAVAASQAPPSPPPSQGEPTSGQVNFVQNGVVITGPVDISLAARQIPNISTADRQANGIVAVSASQAPPSPPPPPQGEPTSGPVNFFQGSTLITGPVDFGLVARQVPNISAADRQANGIVAVAASQAPPPPPPPPPTTITNPSTGDTVVDLSISTGQTVSSTLFGVATGALIDLGWEIAANTGFQASAKTLDLPLIRFNANGTNQLYGTNPAAPNFALLNNWINNKAKFFSGQLIFGIGPDGNTNFRTPAYWASAATATANYLRSIGQECFWWEIGNENDETAIATYNAVFNAVADALHAVNPAYKVGGPALAWANPDLITPWAQACGSRIGFVSYHAYPTGGAPTTAIAAYDAAIAESPTDAQQCRQALAGTPAANVPIFLGEYNMSWQWNPGEPMQSKIQGAVFDALYLAGSLDGDNNIPMGALWDIVSDTYFGVIAPNGTPMSNIVPGGYYLSKAAKTLPGARVSASPFSTRTKVLATKGGGKYAIQLVNYHTTLDRTVAVAIKGGTPTSCKRWVISAASPAGSEADITNLGQVSVPSQSVVILTGTYS